MLTPEESKRLRAGLGMEYANIPDVLLEEIVRNIIFLAGVRVGIAIDGIKKELLDAIEKLFRIF